MDQYSYIRTAVRVYQKGIRELSEETGHSRVTIRKVLREEARGYSTRQHQVYPALGPYIKIINGWLEGDKGEPRKQRHTARRIYHRLVNEHGYAGSEETVRRYVRLAKPGLGLDGPEVFVVTDPECGREAEVDWGRAGAVIRGVKTPIYYFCMRSRFSGKPFVRAYQCEKQQAFFDGHLHAFEFFGGVFPTLVYDNLKSAVQKILSGRGRIEQESFQRFRAYYTFAARFCNAGCGNEKGGTEGLVGYARRNFLVPVPVVDSLEELNEQLLEACIHYGDHRIAGREDTVRVLFENEEDHLLSLPAVPFSNVRLLEGKVGHYGTVIADKNHYSAPSGYRGMKVRGELSIDHVDLFYAGKRIARHERMFGNNKWLLEPDHYLDILQRKPGAFDTARVIRQWRATWPEDLERLLSRFKESQGETKGIKDFITVLMLYRQHDPREVESAVSSVLSHGLSNSAGVKQLLLQTASEGEIRASGGLAGDPGARRVRVWTVGRCVMTEGTALLLTHHLHELKLGAMLKQYPSLVRQARESGQDYEEFLLTLAETEIQTRSENRLKRRIRDARFPLIKTFEQFQYESAPGLDRRLIEELKVGGYIRERRNVIFTGMTGTGKTHLAISLGIEACRQGIRSRFVTGSELVNELVESRSERALSRSIQRYARSGLLILDELGYVPFSKEGSQLLFQVMADRYERGSIIVTTNLGFADWTQLFGDPTLTAALLDRLTHKAVIINCDWESYRLRESLKKKKKTAH